MKYPMIKTAVIAASVYLSMGAQALALHDFNLFVAEDYSNSSSVWGSAFIGGNLTGSSSEYGTRLDRNLAIDTLTVVGNINHGNINMMAGSLVHGGGLNSNVNFNGSGSLVSVDGSALAAQRDRYVQELQTASADYKNRSANGVFDRSGNVASFNYSGPGETAVFHVNAEDVFSQNSLLQLNAGGAETVVINVSTAAATSAYEFAINGGVNFGNGFNADTNGQNLGASNILWNFYDATKINMGGLGLKGSLLAIAAHIESIGTTDGSIAARSLVQNAQIHNYNFQPPSEVPLPASIQFMLMGLVTFFALRWRKRKIAAKALAA